MPIKRASLQIPAGLEWVKDLKYFYAVGPTLVGKDFNSVDTTVSISFPPGGSITSLIEYGSTANTYLEVQGASWINPSDAANSSVMTTTREPGNTNYSGLDYQINNNFGELKPYFESTKGVTAGKVFYLDKVADLYEIESSGSLRKLTPNRYAPGYTFNYLETAAAFAFIYSAQYARIFYEDTENFYAKCLINSHSQIHTGTDTNRVTHFIGKISKSTYQFERYTVTTDSTWEQLLIQLFESDTKILFLKVQRNFGGYYEYNNANSTLDSSVLIFDKLTGTTSINSGLVTADVQNFLSNKSRYSQIGATSFTKSKTINDKVQSYFIYQDLTNLSIKVKSLELPPNLSDTKLNSNSFECTISNAPGNLFSNSILPQVTGSQSTQQNLQYYYSLSKFTESTFEYLVLHIHPRKSLPEGLTQKHIVFSINSENPRQLTYVTHYEVIGTYYNGVLPSPDGKSFLLVNDTSFLLLNWNGGSRSLVPSKIINTKSIIRRAAYDALNRIWINTSTDSDGNALQDQLDIYYPTGTKYVKLSPKSDTTLEYLGTPLQPEFDVSVFDLTGARLQQNVTLEVVGATFLGGSSVITVQTSSSNDVTVKLNITAPGAIQIVATDF